MRNLSRCGSRTVGVRGTPDSFSGSGLTCQKGVSATAERKEFSVDPFL